MCSGRGGRQSVSADSTSTTSTSTRDLDATDEDEESGLTAECEQDDDDSLAIELRDAIVLTREQHSEQGSLTIPGASGSGVANEGTKLVLAHLPVPNRMEG